MHKCEIKQIAAVTRGALCKAPSSAIHFGGLEIGLNWIQYLVIVWMHDSIQR